MEPTTGTSLDPVIIWSAGLVAIAGGVAVVWKVIGGLRRVIKRVDEFMDDWNGIPERPGHPAQPGVMVRLDAIEHQLTRNSGSSLRDAVDRIERELRGETSTEA